jgi:hypothetical protein
VKEVYSKHWKKRGKGDPIGEFRAIRRAIETQVVCLCNSRVCDTNIFDKGDPKGDPIEKEGRSNVCNDINNIYSLRSYISDSVGSVEKKEKKQKPPKVEKEKPPKVEKKKLDPELLKKIKKTIEVATELKFPLTPAEISRQCKVQSIEAVRKVIAFFANEEFNKTPEKDLKAAIYYRIKTENEYIQDFGNENKSTS